MNVLENAHLEEVSTELKRQQEELKLYFYRVIHDIKAPICSLVSLVRLTKSQIKDKESQQFLTEMENYFNLLNIEISSSLKNNIVFSENIQTERVNIETVLFEVVNILTFSRDLTKVRITPIVDKLKDFRTNRQLVFSILQNIIDNAIKHGRHSDNDQINITIKISQEGNYLKIDAIDDGIGMTEKTKQSLFEKFNSNDHLLTKGNGLGLYLIRKSIDKLNGEITIVSEQNKGTCFTILIPES